MKNKKQKLNIYHLNFIRKTLFNIGKKHCSIKLISGTIVEGVITEVGFDNEGRLTFYYNGDSEFIKHSTTFNMVFTNKNDMQEIVKVDMFDIENIRTVETMTYEVISGKKFRLFGMGKLK